MNPRYVLASDIDNTLTGDPVALQRLAGEFSALRQSGDLYLILCTGRRLDQVLEGINNEGLPQADAVISQVGTEIYLPPFTADSPLLKAWDEYLHEQFSREQAVGFLEGIEGLQMQPEEFNTSLKVSCYLDQAPDPEKAVREIRRRVAKTSNAYQVVWSSGRDLDILPSAAGKGKAISFVLNHLQLNPERTLVAGDSGNDRAMFDQFGAGIVVGNAKSELKAMREDLSADAAATVYFAEGEYARGVEEGLQHFGILNRE